MSLLDLPVELIEMILGMAIRSRGVRRGLRLRLVNGVFARAVIQTIFSQRLLDTHFGGCATEEKASLPSFLPAYLSTCVKNEPRGGRPFLLLIRDVAERLGLITDDGRAPTEYIEILCQLAIEYHPVDIPRIWTEKSPSERSDFDSHLLVAAVATRTKPLLHDWAHGEPLSTSCWLWGSSKRYALGHDDLEVAGMCINCKSYGTPQDPRLGMLKIAAESGRLDAVKYVWDFESEQFPWTFGRRGPNDIARRNHIALWQMHTPTVEVFEWLMQKRHEHCPDRIFGRKESSTFLSHCICSGWVDMAARYLELGADVNGVGSTGYDVGYKDHPNLVNACRLRSVESVELLLRHGADTSKPALQTAVRSGSLPVVHVLLEHNAELGESVREAAAAGYKDVMEELFRYGAGIEDVEPLLLSAIDHEHEAMFELILRRYGQPIDPLVKANCSKGAIEKGLDSMLQLVEKC